MSYVPVAVVSQRLTTYLTAIFTVKQNHRYFTSCKVSIVHFLTLQSDAETDMITY